MGSKSLYCVEYEDFIDWPGSFVWVLDLGWKFLLYSCTAVQPSTEQDLDSSPYKATVMNSL